jgi:HEAT repeat protein
MTPPAPSPAPTKRSKRMYVLWATALTLLLTLGLFCWLVVVPYFRVRAAIERCAGTWDLMPQEIERLGGPELAARDLSLYTRLPDRIADRKRTAALLLGRCGKPAVPALVGLLGNKDEYVRWYAAYALGRIGPEAREAVPALARALGDNNKDVRRCAAEALGRIGPEAREVVPALVGLLGDENKYVRGHAAEALGWIGLEAREAIPALGKLLNDECEFARKAAADALKKIKAAQEKR